MSKSIHLARGERVIAVVPEKCGGPGWRNAPVWVYITNSITGESRDECLQPTEQTPEMLRLFDIGAAVHSALVDAVPTVRDD